jgi:hypothetical protein
MRGNGCIDSEVSKMVARQAILLLLSQMSNGT